MYFLLVQMIKHFQNFFLRILNQKNLIYQLKLLVGELFYIGFHIQ